MSGEHAIRARDLWFTYKPAGLGGKDLEPSLRGVSLAVERGEVYGVLGPNAAGKTTLIKSLATLLLPDKGELEVLGERMPHGEPRVRGRIGLVLAEYERTFHLRLTARQNLRFFASFLDLPRRDVDTRIDEVLGQVDLAHAGDKMFTAFSTGMKHRLAVARALLAHPELLVLDEPTAGLDAETSRQLGDLVLRLAREENATVLYTTHRLEEAGRLCDRIAILRKGRVIAEESPAALRKLAQDVSVISLTLDRVDDAIVDAYRALPGVHNVFLGGNADVRLHVTSVPEVVGSAVALAEKHARRVMAVRSEEPTVEDVFLKLTRGDDAEEVTVDAA